MCDKGRCGMCRKCYAEIRGREFGIGYGRNNGPFYMAYQFAKRSESMKKQAARAERERLLEQRKARLANGPTF